MLPPAVLPALAVVVMAIVAFTALPGGGGSFSPQSLPPPPPPPPPRLAQCQRLDAGGLSPARFRALVRANEPVVLVGAGALPELRALMARWQDGALPELLRRHGDEPVRVSLSRSQEFEGVEHAADWPGAERFWAAWRGVGGSGGEKAGAGGEREEALSAPGARFRRCGAAAQAAGAACVRHVFDRVVVRPATVDSTLREVLGDSAAHPLPRGAAAAYVQYERAPPALLAGGRAPAFAAALLRPEFTGLWLGRGRTRAQLHYDASENLLLVLRGTKRWTLLPPAAGDALHEGYMLEVQQEVVVRGAAAQGAAGAAGAGGSRIGGAGAQLGKGAVGLSNASLSFFTSPVSLPAAPGTAEGARFPGAAAALQQTTAVGCEVRAGEMLFVPSWWWHQVETEPEPQPQQGGGGGLSGFSAAINFWYEPYFTKPYACAGCKLRRNTKVYAEGAV
jgi:hypothetical protein